MSVQGRAGASIVISDEQSSLTPALKLQSRYCCSSASAVELELLADSYSGHSSPDIFSLVAQRRHDVCQIRQRLAFKFIPALPASTLKGEGGQLDISVLL
jgi:hypothetical protein